ncbi:MAG: class I SAM-dependent methyltransferase [Gammaproteobacteria bacterium]|nr:class I SAM-dependent methyltransferase [Gammaproteobacteria bacterium]MCW8988491.1 class I SAM-dependent methyltransferase [Gammaproteobacteria bacterium]MCW9031775.1 class I SAM-dependent methyltransferase [Gammaproteobacteria bacterium]
MDEKKAITHVFNLVSKLYDNPSLRFFPFCAEKMVAYAKIKPGQKVLDVATGTGMVAIAAAQAIGGEGRVQAIDLSENMINQAQENVNRVGITNVDFHVMDGEQPDFKNDVFDIITCSYGLFFMPDMSAALKSWLRVLKPGGKIIFSSFAASAFTPQSDIFMNNLAEYNIIPPTPRWLQLAEEALCKNILEENGFIDAQVTQAQLGYHLNETKDWWQAIQSAGYRGLYEQLPQEHRADFQIKHLSEIEKLKTDKGLWLDVQTLFSTALKPE